MPKLVKLQTLTQPIHLMPKLQTSSQPFRTFSSAPLRAHAMESRRSLNIYLLLHLAAAVMLASPRASSAMDSGDGSGFPDYSPPSEDLTVELQPSDFANQKMYEAYLVIQRFKKTITRDPKGITKTWVGPHVCDYIGFACDVPPGTCERTIAAVDLNGYMIKTPTIVGFVDKLPDLAIFHANTCEFTGKIPDLRHLPLFYELDISNNDYGGRNVPWRSIVKIPQLAFLDMRYNTYKGRIPEQLFEIRPQNKSLRFDVLFLNNNDFEECIPDSIGNTTAKYLTLANNGLSCAIPSTIEDTADTLQEVLFLNNSLSGCFPWEIGKLRKATVIDAGFNVIDGPIPQSLGCLTSLEQLNLARNQLYGEVPDVLCRLGLLDHPWSTGKLLNLSLSHNYFTSLGRSCWWLLEKGILDVRNNCISGLPEQRPPQACTEFLNRSPEQRTCQPDGTENQVPCKLPPPPEGGHNWDDHGAKGTYLATPSPAPSPSVAYAALHGRYP